MNPDLKTLKRRLSKRTLFLCIAIGLVLVISLGIVFLRPSKSKQIDGVNASPSNNIGKSTLTDGQKEHVSTVMAYTNAPGADVEQQYILLMTKIGAANTINDWKSVEQYATEALALEGYSTDVAALLDLSDAQQQLNETAARKETLMKLKQYYETNKMSQSTPYKSLMAELK